ncbi:MAG TPA: cyclase family protein [Anaerolineales bacterium]
MKTYYDISVSVHPDIPVWQGDPPVVIRSAASIERVDIANVSRLEIGAHTGTHVDAPVHFVSGRKGVDRLELESLIGPAHVADLCNVVCEITARDFEAAGIPQNTIRLLCKTSNSSLWSASASSFDPNFIGISPDGAQWLISHGIVLVGVDYLGVERFESVGKGAPTHHALLEKEIIIIEGLDLSQVPAGDYTLICLPVKLKDLDGAPSRAILIKE